MHTITYHAADENMGDTPASACAAYRAWAYGQLVVTYTAHIICVDNVPALEIVSTDDEANRDAITEFCQALWDRCPWEIFDS
jgi:hypothetical protein